MPHVAGMGHYFAAAFALCILPFLQDARRFAGDLDNPPMRPRATAAA